MFLVLTSQFAANRKILANRSGLIMQKRETIPQQETLAQLIARLIIAFEEKQARNPTPDRVA